MPLEFRKVGVWKGPLILHLEVTGDLCRGSVYGCGAEGGQCIEE